MSGGRNGSFKNKLASCMIGIQIADCICIWHKILEYLTTAILKVGIRSAKDAWTARFHLSDKRREETQELRIFTFSAAQVDKLCENSVSFSTEQSENMRL